MTKSNDETRELTTDELDKVAGGDSVRTNVANSMVYALAAQIVEDTNYVLALAALATPHK